MSEKVKVSITLDLRTKRPKIKIYTNIIEMSYKRVKNYCITINNPELSDFEGLEAAIATGQVQYCICGKEHGQEKHTEHAQIYIQFTHKIAFNKLKKLVPKAHIEPAKGGAKANIKYCSKEHDYIEYGTAKTAGERTDINNLKTMILETNTPMSEIVDTCENFQQLKYAEGLLKYRKPTERIPPKVYWHYGATGTGKTYTVYKNHKPEDIYVCLDTAQWFDGYTGQKVVLIDDMRKDFCKFHILLKLLDRYPYRVQVKGGTIWFNPEIIYITCPYKPEELYDTREDVAQLERRITKVIKFSRKKKSIIDIYQDEENSQT